MHCKRIFKEETYEEKKKNVTFPINVIIENQPINLVTETVELSVNNKDGKLGDVVTLFFFFLPMAPTNKAWVRQIL